jgi:hypothetical protein
MERRGRLQRSVRSLLLRRSILFLTLSCRRAIATQEAFNKLGLPSATQSYSYYLGASNSVRSLLCAPLLVDANLRFDVDPSRHERVLDPASPEDGRSGGSCAERFMAESRARRRGTAKSQRARSRDPARFGQLLQERVNICLDSPLLIPD